jgi:hypothetical protein
LNKQDNTQIYLLSNVSRSRSTSGSISKEIIAMAHKKRKKEKKRMNGL